MTFYISSRVSSRYPYINMRSRDDSWDDFEMSYTCIYFPIHLCESAINFNSFSNIYFFTIINLNLFLFYIEITDFHLTFVQCKCIGDCYPFLE